MPGAAGLVILYAAAWDCNDGTIRITASAGSAPDISILSSDGAVPAREADGPHPEGRTIYEAPLPDDSILSIRATAVEGRTMSSLSEAVRTGGQCTGEAVFRAYGTPDAGRQMPSGQELPPDAADAAAPDDPPDAADAAPTAPAPAAPDTLGTAPPGAAPEDRRQIEAPDAPPPDPDVERPDAQADAGKEAADATGEPDAAPAGDDEGGCLIATAAHRTELAPQVQRLREIRDGTLLTTESGRAFMAAFGAAYYAFSPQVADLERENAAVRDAVRMLIAPMLATLSIMALAEDGSEADVLALGIAVIAANASMYVAAPAVAGTVLARRLPALVRRARS